MSTYQKVYFHIVFATQNRRRLIPRDKKDRLHRYISGLVKKYGQDLLEVHCMPDHIHLLISFHNDLKHSELVREIKKRTTRLINEEGWCSRKFKWQEGYGIFTCSASQLERVKKYIENQEEHHRERSYGDEFKGLLRKHDIHYDEKFVLK